jgi:hypothetical protein
MARGATTRSQKAPRASQSQPQPSQTQRSRRASRRDEEEDEEAPNQDEDVDMDDETGNDKPGGEKVFIPCTEELQDTDAAVYRTLFEKRMSWPVWLCSMNKNAQHFDVKKLMIKVSSMLLYVGSCSYHHCI